MSSEYGVVKIDNLPGDAYEMKRDVHTMCDEFDVHPVTIGINAKFGIAYVTLKISDCSALQSGTNRKKWRCAILRSQIQNVPGWFKIPAVEKEDLEDYVDDSEAQLNIALVASLEDQSNPRDHEFNAQMNIAIVASLKESSNSQDPTTSLEQSELAIATASLDNQPSVQSTPLGFTPDNASAPKGKGKMTSEQCVNETLEKERNDIEAIVATIDAMETDAKLLQLSRDVELAKRLSVTTEAPIEAPIEAPKAPIEAPPNWHEINKCIEDLRQGILAIPLILSPASSPPDSPSEGKENKHFDMQSAMSAPEFVPKFSLNLSDAYNPTILTVSNNSHSDS